MNSFTSLELSESAFKLKIANKRLSLRHYHEHIDAVAKFCSIR